MIDSPLACTTTTTTTSLLIRWSFISLSLRLPLISLSLSLSLKVKKLLECVCVCVCFQTPDHECRMCVCLCVFPDSRSWMFCEWEMAGFWQHHQEETEGRWESWSLDRCSSSFPLQSSSFLSVPGTKPSTPAQLSPALKPPLPASLNFLSAMDPFFPLN
jgi:hypothetical protein